MSSTPAPARDQCQEIATQLVYGDGRMAAYHPANPAANIDHLFAMYDESRAAFPVRQGTSSGATGALIHAGRLGSDLGDHPTYSILHVITSATSG